MENKLKRGRKPILESEKKKPSSVYINKNDKDVLIKKYGSLTNAINYLLKIER